MGGIADQFARAFRDFNTDGLAASGIANVDKRDARAIGPLIEAALGTIGLGALIVARFPTLAAANASLAYADGAIALVYNDATGANNDLIVKSGASGTGSWAPTTVIHQIISALATVYTSAAAASATAAAGSATAAAGSAASISGLIADAAGNSDVLVALINAAGLARGYIGADGTYAVERMYLGANGVRSGLFEAYLDRSIAGEDILLVDASGLVRAVLSSPAVSSSGGSTTPTVVQNQPNAAWRVRAKLDAGLDANILICSDSTGAGVGTWSYLMAASAHAKYPSANIVWRYWDNLSVDRYGTPVTVYAGAGPTLTIWCAARAGSSIWYQMGSLFDVALGDGPFPGGASADWVIVNHGRNHANQTTASTDTIAASLIGPMQRLMSRHPSAGYSIFAQPPMRDDGSYAGQAEGTRIAAQLLGWSLIDAYSLFLNAGKPAGWYADNIHPSATGYQQIVDNLLAPLWSGQITQNLSRHPLLDDPAPNLIDNGDFSSWSGGVPVNWSVIGGTVTQDTSLYETSGSAVLLTGNGGASAQGLRKTLTGDILRRLRGRFLVVACRQYFPPNMTGGNDGGAYGPNIVYSIDGGATWSSDRRGVLIQYANGRPAAEGGWIWHCATTLIPANATHVRVETSGGSLATGQTMNIDRVVLSAGSLPHDMEF